MPGPDDAAPAGDGDGAWEIRIAGDVDISDPEAIGPADLDVWTRFVGAPDDPAVDQALLAFATDGFLIGTAMRPHAGVGQAQAHVTVSTGVISHTLTFHEPAPAGEWLLLSHHSPYAGRGRCLRLGRRLPGRRHARRLVRAGRHDQTARPGALQIRALTRRNGPAIAAGGPPAGPSAVGPRILEVLFTRGDVGFGPTVRYKNRSAVARCCNDVLTVRVYGSHVTAGTCRRTSVRPGAPETGEGNRDG